MGSQMIELKSTNHKSNITAGLQELYLNDVLLDVTIACGEFSLKAHKTVLSASSSFFQKLFINNPCKHPILIMTDVDFGDLKTIVEFIYQGEIHISQEKLTQFLKIADRLKIKGLVGIEGIKENPPEHFQDVESQYPYDAWEHTISHAEHQVNTQANDFHYNVRKVTDNVQNEVHQQISSTLRSTGNIKLECDVLRTASSSCMHWQQNEYSNQTSCSAFSNSAAQCTTTATFEQPLVPSVSQQLPHQFSSSVSKKLSSPSLSHPLSAPSVSSENGVCLNDEQYIYSGSQNQSGGEMSVQVQEENRKDAILMNHFQDQSNMTAISTKPFRTAESLSCQGSSHHGNGKTVKGDFADSVTAFTTARNSEGNFDTFEDFSHRKTSFDCEVCRSSFLKEEELTKHKELHSKSKKFTCELCNISVSSESSLQRHLKVIHCGEKEFYCKICHKEFSSRSGFEYHKRTHSGEKPFRCKMCAKKFPSKGGLRCHIRKHNGEKPFTCKVCHKQFFWQSSWQCHESTHNGQK